MSRHGDIFSFPLWHRVGLTQGNERFGDWWHKTYKGDSNKGWDWFTVYQSWIFKQLQEAAWRCSSLSNIRPLQGFPSRTLRSRPVVKNVQWWAYWIKISEFFYIFHLKVVVFDQVFEKCKYFMVFNQKNFIFNQLFE